MGSFIRIAGALALLVLVTAASASGARESGFRLPDGSAGCTVVASGIACATTGVAKALVIERSGTPRASSVAVRWNARTPVLRGEWRSGAISCRVAKATIVCSNAAGATIFVGNGRLAVAL